MTVMFGCFRNDGTESSSRFNASDNPVKDYNPEQNKNNGNEKTVLNPPKKDGLTVRNIGKTNSLVVFFFAVFFIR